MTFAGGQPQIRLWRSSAFTGRRWRWHLKAANGLKIGQQAQGNGFRDKRDVVANLEEVLGGVYVEGFRLVPQQTIDGHFYAQGHFRRFAIGDDGGPVEQRIFVQVLG